MGDAGPRLRAARALTFCAGVAEHGRALRAAQQRVESEPTESFFDGAPRRYLIWGPR